MGIKLSNSPNPLLSRGGFLRNPLLSRGGRGSLKHVIFDWAGTLYDDHRPSFITTQKTIKALGGKVPTFLQYKHHFTLPVSPFYRRYGVTCSLKKINHTFFKLYDQHYQEGRVFAGVRETLKFLKKRGVTLSIFSTLRQDYLRALVKKYRLRSYFILLHGSVNDKCCEMKKHLKAIRKSFSLIPDPSSLTPSPILFIGDTDHDIEAAQKNGLMSGCVLNGYHHPVRLKKMDPDFVWKSQRNWLVFFKRYFKKEKQK